MDLGPQAEAAAVDPGPSADYVNIRDLVLVKRKNVLLVGFGGSGKSYVIRALAEDAKLVAGMKLRVTATTGIAAINVNGTTLHRFFGIGLAQGPVEQIVEGLRYRRKDAIQRICETNVLVIDEVSMLSEELFDKLDYICKVFRRCQDPFGGLQVLISGDFLQLPPVKGEWVFKSPAWHRMGFVPVFLNDPKRFTDKTYSDMLLRIREGVVKPQDLTKLRARVVAYRSYLDGLKTLTEEQRLTTIKPTKIYPHRARVEDENDAELEKLECVESIFQARDTCRTPAGAVLPPSKCVHYAETLDAMAPKLCRLKLGAQVMLTYNLDVENGLCNGSRGVVTQLHCDSAIVKFMARPDEPIQVPYTEFTHEDANVKLSRMQLPLVLAWAQTIHKSQGSTLDFCVADVGPNVFAAGQAYVALSRARNWDSLLLANFDSKAIKVDQAALAYVRQLEVMAG